MVLVDTYAVKTELLGILELVKIAVVKQMSLFWIVKSIGQCYPRGRVFAFIAEVGWEFWPWHKVEEVELHSASLLKQR
jgi:hypothetical protein